ncbi:SDR family NAD(P)-dependent oxidoreductase [Rhizobium sp. 2MFCol3.1]|uniref:SDR family NAD(P)-dependent oxidoreductase n=1 Tax=Rhizobium sp. 2MFCol3.1 TaxID=1246459 RepID=UPI00037648AC|nr:SDR family NAD(P)-dependent oxidoreductase [Rhizobium sp. 2MFCol3.1]
MSSKRILVTGGAGFIGSELVAQLARQGHEIIVIDNLSNGKRENLDCLGNGNVHLVTDDIRDTDAMQRHMKGASTVYHLACLGVRHSLYEPFENHDVNATGTLRLLQVARSFEVARFVHVSSSEVYGTASTVPMTEMHPTYPMTVYGAGKLAGECYARAFYRSYGFPTVVVRPFNSFGPRSHHEGDSGEVIPKFMLRAMAGKPLIIHGDGTQTRDFSFVTDTARAIMQAAEADEAVGMTINVGAGKEISINDLALAVKSVVGSNSVQIVHEEPRPGDVLRLCADSSQAADILGFQPTVSLKDGLRHLHQWYLAKADSVEELLAQEQKQNWKAA